MITAVDTNILLDVLIPDVPEAETSQGLLEIASQQGSLVMSEIVYAELAAHFPTSKELDNFLTETDIHLMPCQPEALVRAGQAWVRYLRRRRGTLFCAACGRVQRLSCQHCGASLHGRQHLVSDFLIGAHAELQTDQLLTPDRGYYRTYFQRLTLVQRPSH